MSHGPRCWEEHDECADALLRTALVDIKALRAALYEIVAASTEHDRLVVIAESCDVLDETDNWDEEINQTGDGNAD